MHQKRDKKAALFTSDSPATKRIFNKKTLKYNNISNQV